MGIIIDRAAREAVYEALLDELTGSGDVWEEIKAGTYEAARRTRDRLVDDMRLLDDIGWEPEPEEELFELTMPRADLARVLRTLNGNARPTVHEQVTKPLEEADLAQRALLVQGLCGELPAQIADESQAAQP